MVDLPEPEKPVKNTTRPRCRRGGRTRASSLATAGGVCHSGSGKPRSSRSSISAGVIASRRLRGGMSSRQRHWPSRLS